MIHLAVPVALACALAGVGAYALLARRHLVMALLGLEMLLAAAGVLLVALGLLPGAGEPADPLMGGEALALMLIVISAAEVVVAIGIAVALHRATGAVRTDTSSVAPGEGA